MSDDDNESSAPIPIPRRKASPESASIANLGACFDSLALHCREVSRRVDGAKGTDRERLLREFADFVAQVRDLADDTVTAAIALIDE